jgi:tRNA (Thr-GGU) A37 N-methylase
VRVQGLDAIDGTPVIDIKPYVPAFDRVDRVEVPGWMDEIMRDYFVPGRDARPRSASRSGPSSARRKTRSRTALT